MKHDVKPADFMNAILIHYDYLIKLDIFKKYRTSLIRWVQAFSNFHYNSVFNASARKIITDCIKELSQKLSFDASICLRNIGKSMTEPKISVLIPVYNVEKYLDEAIQSVLCQTLHDIEIICINDGSTDHSLAILQKYQKLDSRIRIINKNNTRYGHSMNIGLQVACGEYIAILEPDDYILPNMYELLYQKAKQLNLDFVKSDYYRFTGLANSQRKQLISVTHNIREDYNRIIDPQKEYDIPCELRNWCGIYNRQFLVKNRILYNETPGASYQDNGFFIKTFCCAKKIMFINQPLYMYRCDNANASVQNTHKIGKVEEEYKQTYQWIVDYSNDHKTLYVYFYRLMRCYLWIYDTEDSISKKEVYDLLVHLCKTILFKYPDIASIFFEKSYTKKFPLHHVNLISQIVNNDILNVQKKPFL